MRTLLSVRELYFRYQNDEQLIEGLDLELHEGELLGIIGPNGGGKSTLLKLIVGQLWANRGHIHLLGQRPFAYLPQNQELNDLLPVSVKDLVELGQYGAGPGEQIMTPHQALELVNMQNKADHFVRNLSGGERQRVLIAKSLVQRPEILIMDEPSKGLDKKSMDQLFTMLKDISQKMGTGIILVDHHITHVMKVSDKLLCLGHQSHWHDKSELLNKKILEHIYDCELELALLESEGQGGHCCD